MELEANLTVSASESGWLLVNVTRATREWTYFSATNYGLYLSVTDSYGKDTRVLFIQVYIIYILV